MKVRLRQSIWLALIVTYAAAVVAGVVGVFATPDSGVGLAVSDGRVVIEDFDQGSVVWSEGGRVGDVVVLINEAPAIDAVWSGEMIRDISVRPAETSSDESLIHINVISRPTSMIAGMLILNVLALSFVVMAVLIQLRAKRSTITVMFAFMAVSMGIALAIGPASLANHMWGRLAMGAGVYMAAAMFIGFFYLFSRASSLTEQRRVHWLPELTTLISAVLVIPWGLAPVIGPAVGVDLFAVLRPGMFLAMALAIGVSSTMIVYRLRTAEREDQERLRIVTLGTVLGSIPLMWLTVIPQIISGSQIFSGELTVFGLILIPFSFGYAIARHDLMGINRLFQRGAAYAIITAGTIILYGSVLTGLNLLTPDTSDLGPIQGTLFVLMFAAAPMLSSVRRRAIRLVDRLLYEGAVTQGDLVSAISTVSASENDPDRVLRLAASFAGQGFEVEYAAVLIYRNERAVVEHVYKATEDAVENSLVQIPLMKRRGVTRSTLPGTEQSILVGSLREIDREPRMIVLGPKLDEDIFSDEDVRLLETVSSVVSTALTRIRLISEVREQSEQLRNMGSEIQNIQEFERQEISAYLHDEPLQKLAYVNSRIHELDISEDLKAMLGEVVRDLRGTSASLSPETVRSHGVATALTWMAGAQQERGPFRVFVEIEGVGENDRFPDDVELTIYRTAQEALNNCRKHADAKTVWIKFTRTNNVITLSVEDNGVGIDTEAVARQERSPDQGLGLRGVEARVKAVGGTFDIRPRASRGTALVVTLPLQDGDIALAS